MAKSLVFYAVTAGFLCFSQVPTPEVVAGNPGYARLRALIDWYDLNSQTEMIASVWAIAGGSECAAKLSGRGISFEAANEICAAPNPQRPERVRVNSDNHPAGNHDQQEKIGSTLQGPAGSSGREDTTLPPPVSDRRKPSGGGRPQSDSGDALRIGPGITQPVLRSKVEPEYSPEARAGHIQGTVVLQVVINEQGRPVDISVISPLGFGLDEQAEAAVEKWKFSPGMMGNVPVQILATVEVNFRIPGLWFDEKAERNRIAFNVALLTVNRSNAGRTETDRAVKSILDLCQRKFAPAMYVAGLWSTNGEHVVKDAVLGLDWIQKAAERNYGPALYEVAIRQLDGADLPLDIAQGLKRMHAAASLGSQQAALNLGTRYETGSGVVLNMDRAAKYYRLCAADGLALCQYRLGRLLYEAPDRRERDYLQAVALFQLAAERGLTEAVEMAAVESSRLTPGQVNWVTTLKGQIVRK